ncbi:MAG: phosphatase PAP2 family protein [Sphingorhabdus sp.]|nr:phosphatase PAP2 family protein [Sphingorhabdus sp.]
MGWKFISFTSLRDVARPRTFIPEPLIEPQLRWLYVVWFSSAAIALGLIIATRFTVTTSAIFVFATPVYLIIAGMLCRRIGRPKLGSALEGLGLYYSLALILMFVLFPLTAMSGPYADAILSSWDRAIGFDWHSYLEITRPYTKLLLLIYNSFGWQPALVILVLAARNSQNILRQFLMALSFAAAMTALIFPFLPAKAPFEFYGITQDIYPELIATGTRDFLPLMDAVKNGARVISPETFTGVVAFPSFHAACALLFAWALWNVPYLRWPVALLNIAMIASTPVIGNHYLVDVFAGLVIGFIAILLARNVIA